MRGVRLGLRGLQVRVVRQGPRHEVIHGDLPCPVCGLRHRPTHNDQGHPEEPDQQDRFVQLHGLSSLK